MLGALAFRSSYRAMLVLALIGLGFSLYLTRIEAHILGVYCIYCVISLGIISLMTLLVAERVIVRRRLTQDGHTPRL